MSPRRSWLLFPRCLKSCAARSIRAGRLGSTMTLFYFGDFVTHQAVAEGGAELAARHAMISLLILGVALARCGLFSRDTADVSPPSLLAARLP